MGLPLCVQPLEFIAHRGSSFLAPENTLASFALGWQETSTCELDVQLTGDGKLLVIHDDSTLRTTGIDWKVAEHSLQELQRLDAGRLKGERWKGERLPSLEEVITVLPRDKRLLIEIKAGLAANSELDRVIRASGKMEQLALQSFDLATCRAAKLAMPSVAVHLLVASHIDAATHAWTPLIEDVLAQVKDSSLNGIGMNDTDALNTATVRQVRHAGIALKVWTVDDPTCARRIVKLGVDGLITNRPAWLRGQLQACVDR